jgi:DNA-binding CsgD family transcriptional regulator
MTVDFPVLGDVQLTGRRSECDVLDGLIEGVRAGESRALVIRGEPGVGKTALLDYVADHASGCMVARAAGVQSEMELAFAGVHQLCAPMLDHLDRLPGPQRDALRTALGISAGTAPDRFLVGLAILGLLSDVAEKRPLICLVDDVQWIDRASAQVLAFVARRLDAESVGVVFGLRKPSDDLAGLPELALDGLREEDARSLLDSVLPGPLDVRVRDRIVAETRGNPLALLELPRGLTLAEQAGGLFAVPFRLSARVEDSFRQRLESLPTETRRLLVVAAAEALGDPLLVSRAAERLGIGAAAATPAAEAGLLEFGARVLFRHPLVRAVAYRTAPLQLRHDVHRALAEVTDPALDPDRRAWHRALAAPGPDEDVAEELERSAGRAQARGGLAAAAAFLERAAMLTRDPGRRAERQLAAARTKRDIGALDAALGLLVAVETGPPEAARTAELEYLRGQIALLQRRGTDAARLLRDSARRLEPLNPDLARETYLEALGTAMWAGDLDNPAGVLEAAKAARAAARSPEPLGVEDVLLDAFALRLTEGYTAAAPALTRALELALAPSSADDNRRLWLTGGRAGAIAALELWDAESSHTLAVRLVQLARDSGAVPRLQFALNTLAWTHLVAGELTAAALMVDEDRVIAEATGNPPLGNARVTVAAWRGQEPQASELIEATLRESTARGLGRTVDFATYASAVLNNGTGRHAAALDAARRVFELDQLGYGPFVVPELVEAASRTGDTALVRAALEWMSERARVTPTNWALGIEARVRALLSEGEVADSLYRESIAHLGRTRVRAQLARGHLLYGEWLRRERRRMDARVQLRIAHDMLDAMGIEAFAERARRELQTSGETARKRSVETTLQLTAQEALIARLARDGLSNPEIGARLFISPRTVKYHLRKVFIKLDVTSRNQLDRVLPSDHD